MAFEVTYRDNDPHWFAAYVRVHQERKVAQRLGAAGLETYVPLRREKHKWSDRIKLVDVPLIPSMVFVRCTELQRLETLRNEPRIVVYMSNHRPFSPTIVPDNQMIDFQRVCKVGPERVEFEKCVVGDRVRITAGPLKGMEGLLVKKGNLHSFSIEVENIGFASIDIRPEDVEKIR